MEPIRAPFAKQVSKGNAALLGTPPDLPPGLSVPHRCPGTPERWAGPGSETISQQKRD